MKVSAKIKYYRTLNKMSQQVVADHCCVARETVANWEGGRRLPSIETINDLSNLFNVPVAELIGKKERRYVLVSTIYDKFADTSVFSHVLNCIKGILAIIIMVPLLICIPLYGKENEENTANNKLVNEETLLVLEQKIGTSVIEHPLYRIDDEEIKNITKKYSIISPNHKEINEMFIAKSIEIIAIVNNKTFSSTYNAYFNLQIRDKANTVYSYGKIDFIPINSYMNNILLTNYDNTPYISTNGVYTILLLACDNSFYIGAFLIED